MTHLPIRSKMRVNANSGPLDVSGPRHEPVVPKQSIARDQADLSGAEGLDRAGEQAPDIRAENVARAKALLADKAYPPPTVLREIATRLSRQIEDENT
jgi:hypothetical protein